MHYLTQHNLALIIYVALIKIALDDIVITWEKHLLAPIHTILLSIFYSIEFTKTILQIGCCVMS
jgi:hypothetical protein